MNSLLYAQLVLCYKIVTGVTQLRVAALELWGRCHNLLRDVAKSIAVAAGYTVFSEQTIPSNHALRPADILIHNWKEGKPLALDFTVSTPSLNADSDPELKIAA